MLPTFSGLTKISINGIPQTNFLFSWHKLPETFCQGFLHILHVQDMEEVAISNVTFFPLSLLDDCKNRNVKVTLDMCHEPSYDKTSKRHGSFPPLERLSVKNILGTRLEGIATWIQTHGLRSPEYKVPYRQVWQFGAFLPQLLAACSSTLTDFCTSLPSLELDLFKSCHTSSNFTYLQGIWDRRPK